MGSFWGVGVVAQRYWLVGAQHFSTSRTMLSRYVGQQLLSAVKTKTEMHRCEGLYTQKVGKFAVSPLL
jgi:hypothetical protein